MFCYYYYYYYWSNGKSYFRPNAATTFHNHQQLTLFVSQVWDGIRAVPPEAKGRADDHGHVRRAAIAGAEQKQATPG